MKIKIPLILLLFTFCNSLLAEPDSMFIYRNGTLIYQEAVSDIDSLSFLPLNHYEVKNSEAVFEEIQSHPELSTFAEMLEMTGYNKLINASTIWAPVNAALENIDLIDLAAVRKTVQLHISKQIVTTTQAESESITVKMLNEKNLIYSGTKSGYTFDGKPILQSDIHAANGVIHILNGLAEYKLNLWEYLNQMDGADSMKSFIQSLNKLEYDEEASYRDGVFMDSVFSITNDVLRYLGSLDNEDSTYTVLISNDGVWNEAYDRLFPYYPAASNRGGVARQTEDAKWVVLRELVLKGKHLLPSNDSIFGKVSPAKEFSNGICLTISQMNQFSNPLKEIRVEAEDARHRLNSQSIIESVAAPDSSEFDISNKMFIRCMPTATSSGFRPSIKYPIPNTLAKAYNIYAVFVPAYILDTTDLKPFKMVYYISYINEAGNLITSSKITPANNITNPRTMTKMLVAENFRFPWGDVVRDPDLTPTVIVRVENDAKRQEINYNIIFLFDCIILEPVEQ